MTTTLIVRDATLAINGAPEKRGEPGSHMLARIGEVARMDPRTAEECVEVLTSVAGGESVAPEVLEALVIVGLAQPKVAERTNLGTLATGRRLAARLEREAQIDQTVALLEVLQKHFPGQESLERDLGHLMRRQGMVQDLVSRYFERAQRLVREGRHSEAAGWLREVLQLDPTRRDAARMMRDLRFKRAKRGHEKSGIGRFLLISALLSLGLSFGALREIRLRHEFQDLQAAQSGNASSLKRRLGDLDRFIARNPFWHGAFQVLAERSALRVQLAVLEERERQEREADELAERERLDAAELYREQGLGRVQSGDLLGALDVFRKALELGGPTWPSYARVSKDVAELEAHRVSQP